MNPATLPKDLLDRVFGRDMHRDGWEVDPPAPANDQEVIEDIDPAVLMALLKRRR